MKKKVYHELRVQRAQQLLGHATSLAAITPGKRVFDVDDLMALMRDLIKQMLPEPDVMGDIREKRARFQCRNKADFHRSGESESHPHPEVVDRRGVVNQTPQAECG